MLGQFRSVLRTVPQGPTAEMKNMFNRGEMSYLWRSCMSTSKGEGTRKAMGEAEQRGKRE